METVLIQRDEYFQPEGIWVFVDDIEVVRAIASKYLKAAFGLEGDELLEAVEDFENTLERYPMCKEAAQAIMEGGGKDGYLPRLPVAWWNW